MITDEMVEAALREFKCWVGDGYSPSKQQIRAALEAAERAAWKPISEAPRILRQQFLAWDGERAFVLHWKGGTWWLTSGHGAAPDFAYFRPLPTLPEVA